MKRLYVRLQPKSGLKTFYRCGIKFSQDWQPVDDVDAATAKRLEAEQMLDVSETRPDELENEAPNADDSVGGSSTGSGSDASADASVTKPDDPAEVVLAILAAIGQLNKEDTALWTAGGKAKTEAVAAITGWPVTAAERDAALAVDE